MKKKLIFFLMILLLILGCQPLADRKVLQKRVPPEPMVINENTNIHFTGKYCDECHERTPVKGGPVYLKYNGDYGQLCGRCHHGMSRGYCHPLDINSPLDRKLTIPSGFPLTDGRFTCNTCHHVYRQCVKRLFGGYMLRGAPYPRKTDFCYRCHNRKRYPALNPHHQILADGEIDVKMCLYCHEKKSDEGTVTYSKVKFIGGMRALCRRCHPIKGNHPANFNHMAERPSDKALAHMAVMETKYGIILPLAEDGKMTCITCHNPHQKGAIPADEPSAKGADSKYRERLPGILCIECHRM